MVKEEDFSLLPSAPNREKHIKGLIETQGIQCQIVCF